MPLTAAEHDRNLANLRDFCNALAALMGMSLNADGTLKDGAVSSTEKLADLIVTQAKLAWLWAKYGTATGTNTYSVTITPSTGFSYSDGLILFVKFANANTGPSTLNVNSAGAKDIVKNGDEALAVGDIKAGQIYMVAYDGTRFQIVASIKPTELEPYENQVGLPARASMAQYAHGLSTTPSRVEAYLVAVANDTSLGFSAGDVLPVESFIANFGDDNDYPAYIISWDATNITVTRSNVEDYNVYSLTKSTGTMAPATLTSWELKLRAWP